MSAFGTVRRVAPAVLLAAILVWNAAGLGLLALPSVGSDAVDPEERRWDMFAPNPLSTGGWYETVGVTETGERVDAFAGTAGEGPPRDVDATYPSHRWYLYLGSLRSDDATALRERFVAYLCERWANEHDTGLVRIEAAFVASHVVLDGPDERERRPFRATNCSAGRVPAAP